VTFERRGEFGYLCFACDEPGKPPTLDIEVLDELARHLDEIKAVATALRAVVVQSNSSKYFIVGANINALDTLDAQSIVPWIRKGHTVFNQLAALPMPVIARIEGYALGGGLELAMACDLLVAARSAKFGQPEANLGIVAGWGGTYRLPRRVGVAKAKELFFTAQIIDAQTAYQIGLINACVDNDKLDDEIDSLLASIRKCGAVAVSQTKALVDKSFDITVEESGDYEAAASRLCMSAGDTQARIRAFLASKGKPRS
jgi:enoyl-CoA hydratase